MKTIILVEDSPQDVELALDVFSTEMQGVRVLVAKDGQDALNLLGRLEAEGNAQLPCLILMDIKMPRMDGKQTLAEIKRLNQISGVPVVMFSSSAELSDISACYQLGANGYVVKPFDPSKYMDTLCTIGRFWIDANTSLSVHGPSLN